jgi:hypothetical protein
MHQQQRVAALATKKEAQLQLHLLLQHQLVMEK